MLWCSFLHLCEASSLTLTVPCQMSRRFQLEPRQVREGAQGGVGKGADRVGGSEKPPSLTCLPERCFYVLCLEGVSFSNSQKSFWFVLLPSSRDCFSFCFDCAGIEPRPSQVLSLSLSCTPSPQALLLLLTFQQGAALG